MIINERSIRDGKIKQLTAGEIAYAESEEMIRLIKRSIIKRQLQVYYDHTPSGCWFIPVQENKPAP